VANDSLHDVRARLKISSQQLPWQRSCYTVAQARMHESICIYAESMHSHVFLSTMHVQVYKLDRCCEHQRTPLLHARYRMCICDRYGDICICVYICICICIYVYVHVYAYAYVYISMYLCMCMCMYMYTYMYVCMHIYMYVHVHMYVYMYICESMCIFAESMHAFTGVFEHHVCAGVYVGQML